MSGTQILLAYPEADGEIRTICENDIVYFSLSDVVNILASQNVKLSEGNKSDGLIGLVRAQLEVLEQDECRDISGDTYITEPGLFRLILRDNSQACKKFQRWVLHDVLPSIQKYGTYPPPLVTQDSDVKRVVKSLLLEIEERELLEKRTKEQFAKHERMLNSLSNKLTSLSYDSNSTGSFLSVQGYCDSHGLDQTHIQLVFGWCLKICAEENEPTQKQMINGEEVVLFPEHVLAQAEKKVVN